MSNDTRDRNLTVGVTALVVSVIGLVISTLLGQGSDFWKNLGAIFHPSTSERSPVSDVPKPDKASPSENEHRFPTPKIVTNTPIAPSQASQQQVVPSSPKIKNKERLLIVYDSGESLFLINPIIYEDNLSGTFTIESTLFPTKPDRVNGVRYKYSRENETINCRDRSIIGSVTIYYGQDGEVISKGTGFSPMKLSPESLPLARNFPIEIAKIKYVCDHLSPGKGYYNL